MTLVGNCVEFIHSYTRTHVRFPFFLFPAVIVLFSRVYTITCGCTPVGWGDNYTRVGTEGGGVFIEQRQLLTRAYGLSRSDVPHRYCSSAGDALFLRKQLYDRTQRRYDILMWPVVSRTLFQLKTSLSNIFESSAWIRVIYWLFLLDIIFSLPTNFV